MKRELSSLRACILAGLAGCATEWPVCGNEQELTAEDYEGYGTLPYDDFLVCGALPRDGDCPDKDQVDAYAFFEENVGETSDNGHGYMLTVDCGPETTRTDACCYVLAVNGEWVSGRPLITAGRSRVAPLRDGTGWASASDGLRSVQKATMWGELARAEHASIAAFAYFTLELLALGAPADLVAASTRAQADEVIHARMAFELASAFGGRAVGPGPLDVARRVGRPDPCAIARALAREGCVAETASAAETALAIAEATTAAERRTLMGITRDEKRHATFAWQAARWLLATFPETRVPFERALADGAAEAAASSPLRRRVVRDVVIPCSTALFH